MLSFFGLPLFVACAKRLSCQGRELVVCTSRNPLDDLVADASREYGLSCVRGDEDDVLSRFVEATNDLGEEDLVIRATADNPLPDGHFLDEMLQVWNHRNCTHLGTNMIEGQLPYGLSLEVFTVKSLRCANVLHVTKEEREHVTLGLKKLASSYLADGNELDIHTAHRSFSIDTLADYRLVYALMSAGDPAMLHKHYREFLL